MALRLSQLSFLVILATPVMSQATAPHSWGQVGYVSDEAAPTTTTAWDLSIFTVFRTGTELVLAEAPVGEPSQDGGSCHYLVFAHTDQLFINIHTWTTKALPILSLTHIWKVTNSHGSKFLGP